MNRCMACNARLDNDHRTAWCFYCGANQEACNLLFSHGIHPAELNILLNDARRYDGIDHALAKIAILAFSKRCELPN